jgi:ribosomal-protein-alanine N-acetyltransferase
VSGEGRGAIRIREATGEDLAKVAAIERQCFADPWSADAFASSLALAPIRFFLAEEVGPGGGEALSGAPVLRGYVVALVFGEEGEVANLAVAPAARRQGLGGILLDHFIAESERSGVRILYLEVRESNVAARRLYESRGFGAVGRRRGYYRAPDEDALVLRRDSAPM